MLPNKLAFVDIETTGGSTRKDRVIEIGIVRVEDNQVVSTYKTLINPQCYLPEEITLLTGITKQDLEGAPIFFDIQEKILEMLEDCIMVAHNVRFDYSFLKNEFKNIGIDFSPKHFCTVRLTRALYNNLTHFNLDALINIFNLNCPNRHRALDDALVLWQLYSKIQKDFDEEIITQAINKALKKPSIPVNINTHIMDNLPENPGVYIFYGEKGMPLYIGKSVNIRKRVLSHFSADHLSPKELKIAQQVESIESIVTVGELGALFTESELIKKMQPLYNRRLRLSKKLSVLRSKFNNDGFREIYIDNNTSEITIDNVDSFLGIFKTKREIKNMLISLAKEFNLCEKLLGIEKSKGACFGYRLGRCFGACINKELPEEYNLRFDAAFDILKIKPWPFNGPVMIYEEDPLERKGEAYIFDRWMYLGKLSFDEFDNSSSLEKNIQFDFDIYKILQSFIKSPKAKKSIKPVDLEKFNYL